MAWGTDFTADIYLSRVIFTARVEIVDKIQSIKDDIQTCREKLLMYSTSNPKDVVSNEWLDQPLDFIYKEIDIIIQDLEDYYRELFELELYLKYYDKQGLREDSETSEGESD